MIQWW